MAEPEQKVFHITELLELILLALPMRDILLLQRVSRFWKGTISGSLKLQQALFLKADGVVDESYEGTFVINPLLEPLFTVIECPNELFDAIAVTREKFSTLHASWQFSEASCQSMLPSRPATVELHGQAEWMNDVIVRRDGGWRVRDILEWIEKECRAEKQRRVEEKRRAKTQRKNNRGRGWRVILSFFGGLCSTR